jgi:hypothetical protein
METDTQETSTSTEKPKSSRKRTTLLFVGSTCWLINSLVPIVPIGAIIGLAICRPKKVRTYILVLVAALIGFAGTGLHVTLAKVKRTNVDTGAECFERKMQGGIRLGTGTIDYFLHRGKMVVYDDPSYQAEVDKANAYVSTFVKRYNANDASFMLESFVYQQGITTQQIQNVFSAVRDRGGSISSPKYVGYLYWVYPKQEHTDITVVHTVGFERECGWDSIHFRLVFFPDGLKLTKIDFVDQEVEYRVVKGMKARNPFKED